MYSDVDFAGKIALMDCSLSETILLADLVEDALRNSSDPRLIFLSQQLKIAIKTIEKK
ncbi:MAG: hypothetical protein RRY42_07885 [Mucinivorans sp.]